MGAGSLYVVSSTIIQMVTREFASREFAGRSSFGMKFANSSDAMPAWSVHRLFSLQGFPTFVGHISPFRCARNFDIVKLKFFTFQSCWIITHMLKVLLRRKFLFLFPSFFNINLLYMFKIIQIAKNWNDTCVRGLEISLWKVRKYRPPLQSSQNNSPRDLRKAVVRFTTWFMHCDVETSTKRFAFGKSLWV